MSESKKIVCDAVIFDVDGTLWDCTGTAVKAYNEVIKTISGSDYQLTPDDLRKNFGKPMQEIGRNLLKGTTEEQSSELMKKILNLQDSLLEEDCPETYPGVAPVMQELAGRYPLFIISNCQAGYIERFLAINGLGDLITDHSCPDDTGRLKAGNITLMAQKHHLLHPVYVGDTRGDEIACRDAGVPFIYASYGFGIAKHPAATISAFPDLLEIL